MKTVQVVGIYRITHLATERHYIGQSQNVIHRWKQHCAKGRDSHINRAIRKYGKEAFEFKVLCECTVDELDSLEIFWIKKLKAFGSGFNQDAGGNAAKTLSDSAKRRLSAAQKERWRVEHGRLSAATRTGLQHAEARAAASAVTRAYLAALSPEEREAWARVRLEGLRKPETLKKIGAATKSRWQDPEMRKKMVAGKVPFPERRKKEIHTFEHMDGRKVEATLWEMANVHKHLTTQKAHNLISGYRKTAQGWKLTGSTIPA